MNIYIYLFIALVNILGLEPCEYEDSLNCYWIGSTRGNGIGDSYIVLDFDNDGEADFVLEISQEIVDSYLASKVNY